MLAGRIGLRVENLLANVQWFGGGLVFEAGLKTHSA